jgi:hypothetical protein
MAMDTVRPPRPTPVDVVSADEAAAVISATEARLAELEQARRDAEALADKAEARARTSTEQLLNDWTALQLERFERQLRAEHETEMRELLAAAEQRANDCIKRAQSERDLIASYRRALQPARAADPADTGTKPARSGAERPVMSVSADTQPSHDPKTPPPPPSVNPTENTEASSRAPISLAGVATRVAHAATWPMRTLHQGGGAEVESSDLAPPTQDPSTPAAPSAVPVQAARPALESEDPIAPGGSGRQIPDDHPEPADETNARQTS